jgi:transposase
MVLRQKHRVNRKCGIFASAMRSRCPLGWRCWANTAKTIKRHWDGVLRWFQSKIANGLLEGINSLIQATKAKACGYRSTRNLQEIIYHIAGKLDMRLLA